MLKDTKILDYGAMVWDPNPGTPLPLGIFIPGIGEVAGSPLTEVDMFGPGRQIASGTWKPNWIMISIQTSSWPSAVTIDALITECVKLYNVDESKIFAFGLSHGAKTWLKYAASSEQYAKRLAGMFIMAPPTISEWMAGREYLKELPIWFVHGTNDQVCKYPPIKSYYDQMIALGFPNKKFTTHNGAHDRWTVYFDKSFKDTVDGHSAYSWLGLTPSTVDLTTTKPVLEDTTTTMEIFPSDTQRFPSEPIIPIESQETTTTTTTVEPKETTTTTLAPVFSLRVEAEDYTAAKGVSKQIIMGVKNLAAIDLKDWIEYKIHVPETKIYPFLFRVSSAQNGASFKVIDGSGNTLAETSVPNTGGWHKYHDIYLDVPLNHLDRYIKIVSTSKSRWNIDYFIINPVRQLGLFSTPEKTPSLLRRLLNLIKNKFGL